MVNLSYYSYLWFFTIFVLCCLDAALTCSSDNDILHTYTTGIITCDMDIIIRSQKEPEKAIKSLFFNTYKMLICILHNCFGSIKASALDAVLMQQVDATEEEVNQAQDLSTLFKCLSIHGNWNKLHFLDVAIISLPLEESVKREAALLVLGQYKSYLRAYQRLSLSRRGRVNLGSCSINKAEKRDGLSLRLQSAKTSLIIPMKTASSCGSCFSLRHWRFLKIALSSVLLELAAPCLSS